MNRYLSSLIALSSIIRLACANSDIPCCLSVIILEIWFLDLFLLLVYLQQRNRFFVEFWWRSSDSSEHTAWNTKGGSCKAGCCQAENATARRRPPCGWKRKTSVPHEGNDANTHVQIYCGRRTPYINHDNLLWFMAYSQIQETALNEKISNLLS